MTIISLLCFFGVGILFSTSHAERGSAEEAKSTSEMLSSLKTRTLMLEMERVITEQAAVISRQEVTSKLQNDAIQQLQNMLQKNKALQTAEADHESPSDPSGNQNERYRRADDFGYRLTPLVNQLSQQVTEMAAQLVALKTSTSQLADDAGTVYTRWGHKSCPDPAQLVYSGAVGGSYYAYAGGASNNLCLSPNPVVSNHTTPPAFAKLYGAEYETYAASTRNLEPACAVCRIPRSSQLMIPGTDTCEPGWTKEYSGYLMANAYTGPGASDFICVDSTMGYLPGTQADQNGKLLYYTIAECGSLSCPPYKSRKVVLCVVCSR